METVARQATIDDAEELTRLRQVMMESIDGPVPREPWWDACVSVFRKELAEHDRMTAFVVDTPGAPGGLAACSVGLILDKLPGPHNPSGRVGYIMNVSTDADQRRRGYARATMEALLEWFGRRGVTRVDLHASTAGEPLYRDLGFAPPGDPALRRITS